MNAIATFEDDFVSALPETHDLLRMGNLVAHPSVTKVRLLGSRGLAGGHRPDSDVDLSLMIDPAVLPDRSDQEAFLRHVLQVTLDGWCGSVELDLAAVWPMQQDCELRCFDTTYYDKHGCPCGGVDCLGIYKIQRGFDGYVTEGVRVDLIHPTITIWQRDAHTT